ncbi:MAG TPA: PAS domain-containing protein [Candidatus Hydrogenedentes bacterium]|nr:PAS domain-containing protein [Candidatus Hydrogenedentota bacterium]
MSQDPHHDYYEQIIDSLTSGVIALDGDGAIVCSNPAAARYLGVPEESLQAGRRLDCVEGVAPFVEAVSGVMEDHEPFSRHEVVLEGERGERVIGMSASLLRGPKTFNGAIFLFTDLTKMRHLERTAELNRQLAQIGELTAGVVHELRNPMTVVSGMAELLLRKIPEDDERHSPAELIYREIANLERAIARFLSFAKPFELDMKPCRPAAIVARAIQLCSHLAVRKGVNLNSEDAIDLPDVTADYDKAAEALGNIIGNAIDAVGKGGHVAVRTFADRAEVVFEVLDDGPGIELEPGEDLFQPFFTKKENGTGLGLSIVRRVITAHGGDMAYANREEGGARFEVRLRAEV